MKKTDIVYVTIASALAVVGLWYAVFHVSGQQKIGMQIAVGFMVISIFLTFFISKKQSDGKKLVGIFSRQYAKAHIPAMATGAAIAALLWWLAYRFLQH